MNCPYCKQQAEFLSSKEFYGQDYGTNLYVCRPCDARVGTHKGSKTALGTMANAEVRRMRMKCHKYFDRKWKSGKTSRSRAYGWLQDEMNLSSEDAHIGMFDKEQCNKLLKILNIKVENKMSLMDAAAQILAEGFDVKKGAVSDFEDLPEGTYEALLENVEWRVSNDGGFEWLSLQYEILTEGFEGRKYFGMINFTNESFLNMNIKLALRVAGAVGVELAPEDFESPETSLVEAFQDGVGMEVDLTLTNWKSKKTGKSGQNFIADEPQFE